MAETQKEKLMRICRLTEAEAEEVLAYDKEVDHATAKERLAYDLSLEEEKKANKYKADGEHKLKAPVKRERKENPTKEGIIAEIATFLRENSQFATKNVQITNKTRQVAFTIGDDGYEITLVTKRKPKSQEFGAEMPHFPQKIKEKVRKMNEK